jgi:hypothetical protein
MPPVCSSTASTGEVFESSMAIAPICSASFSRSEWRSTTITNAALWSIAEMSGHQPDRAGAVDHHSVAGLHPGQLGGVQPVGKMSGMSASIT